MNTIDRYSLLDAAYVLGALSPEERREFEEHLAGCSSCQAAVSELAGMPGLLAQVSPDDAAMLAAQTSADVGDQAPPKTLLPSRLAQQWMRRRRMFTALAAAAAVVALITGIAWNFGGLPFGQPKSPFLLAFAKVQPTEITAVVEVVPQPEGTDFRVECQYATDGAHPREAYDTYGIWIVDQSGTAVEAKTWPAKPNRVMRPQAHSPLEVSRIEVVEIRNSAGQTLLRANLP